jgi:hypothetical protein
LVAADPNWIAVVFERARFAAVQVAEVSGATVPEYVGLILDCACGRTRSCDVGFVELYGGEAGAEPDSPECGG